MTGVALVTGAGGSIGAAIAARLARDGLAVAVNHAGEGDRAGAEGVVRSILEAGGRARAYQADVSDPAAVGAMFAAAATDLGPVTVLVNNAAMAVVNDIPWTEIPYAEWARVMEVNVGGAFICCRAAVPHMRAAGGGSIVNISSITALFGRPLNLHYVTSKAALLGFTRALAREVGPDGIRVNSVLPGAIDTPAKKPGPPKTGLSARQAIPRRGVPDDVVGAVAFLASADSTFITGQSLIVDGGWIMG